MTTNGGTATRTTTPTVHPGSHIPNGVNRIVRKKIDNRPPKCFKERKNNAPAKRAGKFPVSNSDQAEESTDNDNSPSGSPVETASVVSSSTETIPITTSTNNNNNNNSKKTLSSLPLTKSKQTMTSTSHVRSSATQTVEQLAHTVSRGTATCFRTGSRHFGCQTEDNGLFRSLQSLSLHQSDARLFPADIRGPSSSNNGKSSTNSLFSRYGRGSSPNLAPIRSTSVDSASGMSMMTANGIIGKSNRNDRHHSISHRTVSPPHNHGSSSSSKNFVQANKKISRNNK